MTQRVRTLMAFWASTEIWVVAGAVALSILSERLLPLAVGIPVLFWPIRRLAYGRWSVRTPVDGPIVFLALLIPITLKATALPEITLPQVYRLLSGIGLFYALVNWVSRPSQLRFMWIGLLLAGLFFAFVGLIGVDWNPEKIPYIPKVIYDILPTLLSDVVHRNVMAGTLVLLVPLGIARMIFSWRNSSHFERLGIGFFVFILCGVIVLTQSRGAWLAFGVMLLLLINLHRRQDWMIILLAVVLVWVVVARPDMGKILDVLDSGSTVSTLDGRLDIWSRALYVIRDFPFTGVGIGLFGPIADAFYPFFFQAPGSVLHAHNLYLQIAVDLGIFGLIAWLATLLGVSFTAWKVYRVGKQTQDVWVTGLGAGLLASQLALAVHGLFDAVTWGMVRPAPVVWALWGLAIASGRIYIESQTTAIPTNTDESSIERYDRLSVRN